MYVCMHESTPQYQSVHSPKVEPAFPSPQPQPYPLPQTPTPTPTNPPILNPPSPSPSPPHFFPPPPIPTPSAPLSTVPPTNSPALFVVSPTPLATPPTVSPTPFPNPDTVSPRTPVAPLTPDVAVFVAAPSVLVRPVPAVVRKPGWGALGVSGMVGGWGRGEGTYPFPRVRHCALGLREMCCAIFERCRTCFSPSFLSLVL